MSGLLRLWYVAGSMKRVYVLNILSRMHGIVGVSLCAIQEGSGMLHAMALLARAAFPK